MLDWDKEVEVKSRAYPQALGSAGHQETEKPQRYHPQGSFAQERGRHLPATQQTASSPPPGSFFALPYEGSGAFPGPDS